MDAGRTIEYFESAQEAWGMARIKPASPSVYRLCFSASGNKTSPRKFLPRLVAHSERDV